MSEQTSDSDILTNYEALVGEVGLRLLHRVNRGETLTPERVITEILNVFDAALPDKETTHVCPPGGSGVTPCCGRTPFELPTSDRMTTDSALVTCLPDKETP